MPWRSTNDPYAIWISEVMLQQTQVATVIPFYKRFLTRFPTVVELAQAREHDVLQSWEGLGYYRRARALHQAARILCQDHAGQFPSDPAILGALPGLGRYTTNAVLSQAFDRRLAILETNSRRVLCRVLGLRGDPRKPPLEKELWSIAESLLPRRHVGQFNQALMELGALICTPNDPDCGVCPLRGRCRAKHEGLQNEIPPPPAPEKIEEVAELALVIRRGARVLIVQRPPSGRWANLWEFPHLPQLEKESRTATTSRLLELLHVHADSFLEKTTIRHAVTRFRITMRCFEARYRAGTFRPGLYPRARWVLPKQLDKFPLSSPHRRLARCL